MPRIKDDIVLGTPRSLDQHRTLKGFNLKLVYINDDALEVYLNPENTVGLIRVLKDDFEGVVNPGDVQLNNSQSNKVDAFIRAIENAIKNKLEN